MKNKVNSFSDFLETKEINLVRLPVFLDSEVELLGSSLAQLSPQSHLRRLRVRLQLLVW